MLAVTGDGAWTVRTPRLPMKANGSGDLTAALFTAHLRTTGSPAEALGLTASSVVRRPEGDHRVRRARAADRRSPRTPSPTRRGEFEVEQVR